MKKLLLTLLFLPTLVFAQYTREEVIQHLSDNSSKKWVLEKESTTLKGSNSCENGKKYYTFKNEGKLIYSECISNQWEKIELAYELSTESPFDWWITFNEKKYKLSMTKTTAFHKIRLRFLTGGGKKDPTQNVFLKHYLDD